jgi:hypothetical protein
MNPKVLPVIAIAVSLAMISFGCENLSPGGNAAVFSEVPPVWQ